MYLNLWKPSTLPFSGLSWHVKWTWFQLFEHKSIIHPSRGDFGLCQKKKEPTLLFFQMVSQLFPHLSLNNSFVSTNLKCHFYDILNYFVKLGVLLCFLCYSTNLSMPVLEKQFKYHQYCAKSLLLLLSNFIYPLSAISMSHFSSLLNTKRTFPTTLTTCVSHFRGTT